MCCLLIYCILSFLGLLVSSETSTECNGSPWVCWHGRMEFCYCPGILLHQSEILTWLYSNLAGNVFSDFLLTVLLFSIVHWSLWMSVQLSCNCHEPLVMLSGVCVTSHLLRAVAFPFLFSCAAGCSSLYDRDCSPVHLDLFTHESLSGPI